MRLPLFLDGLVVSGLLRLFGIIFLLKLRGVGHGDGADVLVHLSETDRINGGRCGRDLVAERRELRLLRTIGIPGRDVHKVGERRVVKFQCLFSIAVKRSVFSLFDQVIRIL